MNVLAGSLHHGSIVRPPERPHAGDDDMPSMDVLRALHADAQRIARGQVQFASALLVPLLALIVIVGNAPFAFPLLFMAAGIAGWFGDALFEWWALRRSAKRHPAGTLFRGLDAGGGVAALALIAGALFTAGRLLRAW